MNKQKVNIMVGKFQPFTLGHLKCLINIKELTGLPTFLCVIPGNGNKEHPFTNELQNEMYDKLLTSYPDLFAGVCYVKNAFIENWISAIKDKNFIPITWTCGSDRKEAYENMVEKYGQEYGLIDEFQVFVVNRYDDNISATNVRMCLLNDNKEAFMNQMPECLFDMYDRMRSAVVDEISITSKC